MNLEDAIQIASIAHYGQVDKSNQPYILHPLFVMFKTRDAGYNEDCQIVAVLHDVIEDTHVMFADLKRGKIGAHNLEFAPANQDIIDGLNAISRRENETYKEYIERVLENDIATVVKMFDSLHNYNRTDGLSLDDRKFIAKRYGGTFQKITKLMQDEPDRFKRLKK